MRSSRGLVEKAAEALRSAGADIVSPVPREGCYQAVGEFEGRPFFAYFFPGKHTDLVVVKLEPEPRSCYEALYSPWGLYYVHGGPSEGMEALRRKLAIVTRVHARLSI